MKKVLTLFLFAIALMCNSQNKNINYLIGTEKISGYDVKVCSLDVSKINISFSAPAPILQVYIASKQKFIGGTLVDEKGKKTTISNIKLEKQTSGNNLFTIIGSDFSRGFILSNGFILAEEEKETVFYTEKVGIWKIIKK